MHAENNPTRTKYNKYYYYSIKKKLILLEHNIRNNRTRLHDAVRRHNISNFEDERSNK